MPTRATRDRSGATGSESAQQIHAEPAPDNLETLAAAAAALETVPESSSEGAVRTRSGRVSKPPVRYEPVEQVEDDYAPEDYDTEDPDDSSEDIDTDEDEEDDESDADEDGNLDGFVVPDKSESSESDSDGEPAVPVSKRRAVVKKRPAATRA
jgi:hypothetical protein